MHLSRLDYKGIAASTMGSWITCSGEHQAPCDEDTKATVAAYSHGRATLEVNPPAPIKPSLTAAPADI